MADRSPLSAERSTGRSLLARLKRRREGGPSYWLTRFLILRLLGLVYFVAFLSLAHQVLPLLGRQGLLPAETYLERVAARAGSTFDGSLVFPTLFWLGFSVPALVTLAWAGAALSLAALLGYANAILMAMLWALYMTFVHVGQDWYRYGWEIQLLETGFLGIFLCPLLDGRPFPRRAPETAVIGLFRWLIFRIMVGAGLIKLRGDPCWRDLTCLYTHYETQPIPNPLSRLLHFMPRAFHQAGVLFNYLSELVAPWFVIGPRIVRHVAGGILLSFQILLILSGNLSFLNWITIVPILSCFDDSLLRRFFPRRWVARSIRARRAAVESKSQRIAALGLAAVVIVLSVFPVMNLLSGRQVMNTSFNRLELVNTYGAFGSVGKERNEIIFEGTSDGEVTDATVWKPYEFKCKPGDPNRRPCIVSPYHYRLDWAIWFAAMSSPNRYPWSVHLVWKLLHGDSGALSLLANDPFPGSPPRYIRAELYRYEFAPLESEGGAWWKRTHLGPWLPPLSTEDPRLREFLEAYGWLP